MPGPVKPTTCEDHCGSWVNDTEAEVAPRFGWGEEPKEGRTLLAEHVGGRAPIAVDVTSVAKHDAANTTIFHAFDDTRGMHCSTLRDVLKPGQHTIAVHCHQDTGGQFIDVALLVTR